MRLVSLTVVASLAVATLATIAACSSSGSGSSSGQVSPDGGGSSSSATSASSSSGSSGGSSSGDAGDDASDASSSGDPPPNVTTTTESMSVNGKTRTYLLSVPSPYDAAKAYPLVMELHGNPGNAAGQLAFLPFDAVSKQEAVIVYPNALGGNWDLSTPVASNEDVAFIRVLAAEVATKVNLDTARTFIFGYSGGAFFVNQMTCRVPGVVKAFASIAGGAPYPMNGEPQNNNCLSCPGGPTPSIHIHGKDDQEVGTMSGYYAANCWGKTNGCTTLDSNDWGPIAPPPCRKAPGCDANPVEICWVDGVGHEPPWNQSATVAWDFFKSIP